MDEGLNSVPENTTVFPPENKIKRTFKLFKNSWQSFSKKQKSGLIAVFALVLVLPIALGGTYTVKLLSSKAATSASTLIPFTGNASAPFKVMFINLNNSPHFNAIITSTINTKLYTVSPFKENKTLMAFYKTSFQIPNISDYCNAVPISGSSGFYCDPIKIISLLSSKYPGTDWNDFRIAVIVSTDYAGSAGLIITVGDSPDLPEADAARVSSEIMIHEIGHQFGLMDYDIGQVNNNGSPNLVWSVDEMKHQYNLDMAGCSKWCQSYKPVSQYPQSINSACLKFTNKASCVAFERTNGCESGNCCVWSDTPFAYFNTHCVPWQGTENIGINCVSESGCYFGGAYSQYIWRPISTEETIMGDGEGSFDSISQRQIESVFRCCMGSTYSSPLTSNLNCVTYKASYEQFLEYYSLVPKMGSCSGIPPTPTPTPTPSPKPTCVPKPTCPQGAACELALPAGGWCSPTPTTKPTPVPTSNSSCGIVCKSLAGCPASLICYQPPAPTCSSDKACTPQLPAKICRNPSCPTKTDCICGTPTATPTPKATTKPTPQVIVL